MNAQESKIFEAVEFAYKAHKGQMRRFARVPFITHPLSVAKLLAEHGCSNEVVTAAILHDAVEDTSTTLPKIRKKFGQKVATIVEGVTEIDMSYSWEKRKKHLLESLKKAPLEVLMVAIADKIDNLRSMENYIRYSKNVSEMWSYMHSPKERQKWYFNSLLKIFASRLKTKSGNSLLKIFKWEVKKVFG